MESIGGGDLYQLQQEAIRRARETAQKAAIKEHPRNQPSSELSLKEDTLVIAAILAVLLLNGCRDVLLIVALFFLLIK